MTTTVPAANPATAGKRNDDRTRAIAQAILSGFDRHYALFRYHAQLAKSRFEAGDFHAIRRLARERITFYDQRVLEAVARLNDEFRANEIGEQGWQRIKRAYVGLLEKSVQPELAETFFNSVCCKILHRTYFNNDFIFVRPAVATDYLDSLPPSYRVYYPGTAGWQETLRDIVIDIGLACAFANINRDLALALVALQKHMGEKMTPASDCQVHVLRNLFFRNKAAYLIGRVINDGEVVPFCVPFHRESTGFVLMDAVLFGSEQIEALFNFSRAYFMVDMQVPSAYLRFLSSLIPNKPSSEIYSMLGLQKQGKTLFYRDLLAHLNHSHDAFVVAPGIKGLVMGVFTLASFPYVFKYIKDKRKKDVSREYIKSKYQLVKMHDRVGRMADTWEYSNVIFPKSRMHPELLSELYENAPSLIEEEGNNIVIRHLYIERRMVPLNIFLESANEKDKEKALIEYGQAIKDMVAANIFPGDMLYKNFGMTRQGRVVFYDYDEVAYLTDCNFRKIPPPRTPEDEMSSEPWYSVGPRDVFPEEFATFLLGDPTIREMFKSHHSDLLNADFWKDQQTRILAGELVDVFPYAEKYRFDHRTGRDSQ